MLLTTDPPAHTDLRRLVSRAFTPRRVADLEPEIRTLARQFLAGLVEKGEGDLVADYAARLPMDVIARMLGVPRADEEQLRDWTNALLDRDEGVPDVTPAGIEAATHLYKYFCDFVAERRAGHRGGNSPTISAAAASLRHTADEQVVGFLLPADHRRQRDHHEVAHEEVHSLRHFLVKRQGRRRFSGYPTRSRRSCVTKARRS